MTSQSIVICRSPSAGRSSTARRLRPISRWISMVRALFLPADASRRVRSEVARGSMPYSAVTQPRAWPLSQGGRRSSSVAELHEAGALGIFYHAAFERDGAQLVGLSAARPHAGLLIGISASF